MRLSLIGPGDIEFHFYELLKIKKDKLYSELESLAKTLADSKTEIVVLPDKGISFEIARLYKKYKGKRVIGAIPISDKTFGIKHLQQYIDEGIIDETIDTENWYKHDLIKGLLGNSLLYLGNSPGTKGEMNYAVYLYKLLSGRKEGINIAGKSIHPEIKADENFTIFVYSPFLIKGKLSLEEESYIKKFNINLVYLKNSEQLKQELKKFHIRDSSP